MSVCMLMILMYADQLSYDQFHKNKERVYRINTNSMSNGNLRATIPFPVAGKLKAYPFIEEVALLRRGAAAKTLEATGKPLDFGFDFLSDAERASTCFATSVKPEPGRHFCIGSAPGDSPFHGGC